MTRNTTDFAALVTTFLTDYLPLQRNYSPNTILSYRDTLKLFAVFLTEFKEKRLNSFTMKDFDRTTVVEFLEWLRNRGSKISTTNQRLAALKSFAEFAGVECVEYLAPLQNVQGIKSAKASEPEITYLTVEQMERLLNMPDVNNPTGLRHRTTMTLLYDSGCRVQELCDLRIKDVNTGSNPTVRLHGKGSKHRTVTISNNTASLVTAYLSRGLYSRELDQPLLLNRQHKKLSRDGVNYIIQKYVREVRDCDSSFPESLHAHCFRHSKAMHMLAAGINIVYIRDFLGHEDISTTMIYAKADNRLKNDAINKLAPKVVQETEFADWTRDHDLLAFLNSLK